MNELKLNFEDGWQYEYDPSLPPNRAVKIHSPDRMPAPKCLYKFYSLSHFNLDALERLYLYAAARNELNDNFDCLDLFIDMQHVADSTLFRFYKNYYSQEEIVKNLQRFRADFQVHKAINFMSYYGIVSLTKEIFSPTMWAHYADSNNGFAVKFNIENFNSELIGPYPIQYKKSWFPLHIDDYVELLTFIYMTTIKSIHWEYEKEWRYIGVREKMSFPGYKEETNLVENRKYFYSKEAIEEIILGSRFFIGLNKEDSENDTIFIGKDITGDKERSKLKLLDIITSHKLVTSRIILKRNSSTFELDKEHIMVIKLDKDLYQIKFRQ